MPPDKIGDPAAVNISAPYQPPSSATRASTIISSDDLTALSAQLKEAIVTGSASGDLNVMNLLGAIGTQVVEVNRLLATMPPNLGLNTDVSA